MKSVIGPNYDNINVHSIEMFLFEIWNKKVIYQSPRECTSIIIYLIKAMNLS